MAHIHELVDFTVAPIIIHPNKDKILLVNHPRYKKWLSIGGHIELNEDPDQALVREIQEECGLEVEILAEKQDLVATDQEKPLWRPRFVDIHEANPPHRHVSLVYFCLARSADFVVSDEHDTLQWFTLAEIDSLGDEVTGLVKYYAKVALSEVNNG